MEKKIARLRRAKSTRAHIRELGVPRLSVLRTGQHVYAQLFSADGSQVLAAASTTQYAAVMIARLPRTPTAIRFPLARIIGTAPCAQHCKKVTTWRLSASQGAQCLCAIVCRRGNH